jgi:hypothetical protein
MLNLNGNVKNYVLEVLDDSDVEEETNVYFETVCQVKNIISQHVDYSLVEIPDEDVTLLILNNNNDPENGEFALTTVEDYEQDGFIGTTGDAEWMYRMICSWLNGDCDFDDYYEL